MRGDEWFGLTKIRAGCFLVKNCSFGEKMGRDGERKKRAGLRKVTGGDDAVGRMGFARGKLLVRFWVW